MFSFHLNNMSYKSLWPVLIQN